MILFTSFEKAAKVGKGAKVYSIASHQPRGCNYPELRFLAPIDRYGDDIRLSREVNLQDWDTYLMSLTLLRHKLADAFLSRIGEISHWASTLHPSEPVYLCSWPPFSASSRRQIAKYNTFACHSSLVAEVIEQLRPDITVILDPDRRERMIDLPTVGHYLEISDNSHRIAAT